MSMSMWLLMMSFFFSSFRLTLNVMIRGLRWIGILRRCPQQFRHISIYTTHHSHSFIKTRRSPCILYLRYLDTNSVTTRCICIGRPMNVRFVGKTTTSGIRPDTGCGFARVAPSTSAPPQGPIGRLLCQMSLQRWPTR